MPCHTHSDQPVQVKSTCRDNTLEARRQKRALQCWQRTGLRKAWLTWRDHMGSRADAMLALRAVAVRLHAPVLSSAWQAWQAFTARRGAKRVSILVLSCTGVQGRELEMPCWRSGPWLCICIPPCCHLPGRPGRRSRLAEATSGWPCSPEKLEAIACMLLPACPCALVSLAGTAGIDSLHGGQAGKRSD